VTTHAELAREGGGELRYAGGGRGVTSGADCTVVVIVWGTLTTARPLGAAASLDLSQRAHQQLARPQSAQAHLSRRFHTQYFLTRTGMT
jgi:glycerol-3-phosphate dehydrogenase